MEIYWTLPCLLDHFSTKHPPNNYLDKDQQALCSLHDLAKNVPNQRCHRKRIYAHVTQHKINVIWSLNALLVVPWTETINYSSVFKPCVIFQLPKGLHLYCIFFALINFKWFSLADHGQSHLNIWAVCPCLLSLLSLCCSAELPITAIVQVRRPHYTGP
jgi:hypothetical protein